MSATYRLVCRFINLYIYYYIGTVPLANLLFRYTIPFAPMSSGDEHIIIIIMSMYYNILMGS